MTYKFDAKSMFGYMGLGGGDDPPPATELEKKKVAIIEDARLSAGARFVVKLPGKATATNGKNVDGDEKAVKFEIPKKDPKVHEALLKGPFTMKASVAKKDAPFIEKEKAKKAEQDKIRGDGKDGKPPADPKGGGKLGD